MSPWIMVIICFVSGLLLLACYRKQDPIYPRIGVFLLLLGGYKLIDALTDEALSFSWLIWVKRAVLAVMIVYAVLYMWKRYKTPSDSEEE